MAVNWVRKFLENPTKLFEITANLYWIISLSSEKFIYCH